MTEEQKKNDISQDFAAPPLVGIMAFVIVSSPKLAPYATITLTDGTVINKPMTGTMLTNLIMDSARAIGNMEDVSDGYE